MSRGIEVNDAWSSLVARCFLGVGHSFAFFSHPYNLSALSFARFKLIRIFSI